jgi:hypothetical protein
MNLKDYLNESITTSIFGKTILDVVTIQIWVITIFNLLDALSPFPWLAGWVVVLK